MHLLCRISLFSCGTQFFKRSSNLNIAKTIVDSCNTQKFKGCSSFIQQKYISTEVDKSSKKDPQLIYYGNLTKLVRYLKAFSLCTSGSALIAQPFIIMKAQVSNNFPLMVTLTTFCGIFALGTPPLIHFIFKKYATHVYYDEDKDEYIARFYTLFLRRKEIRFTPNDVTIPDVTGPFTSCKIKGTSAFFDEKQFTDLNHYKRIMGYDKPLEFMFLHHSQDDRTDKNTSIKQTENK